jgi:hypothetical protein
MGEVEKIESHIERLVCLVRNATLRRVLHNIDPEPELNFWRISYGNLTDVVVIEWCKTFGANNEDGHWKNVVADRSSFRSEMLEQLRMERSEWDTYWQKMKRYRDKVAVHSSHSAEITDYPTFDVALESAFFYYNYLIKRLGILGFDRKPNDLCSYARDFAAQAKKAAQAALKATANMREKVY